MTVTFLLAARAFAVGPGGFVEFPTTATTRPTPSPSEIASFVPDRGAFTFPPPYNTRGIRITNAADCGGQDCVNYIGYSYWRNINNHSGSNTMLILIGLNRDRGGSGPTLFQYDKTSEQVTKLGPLFDPSDSLSYDTAEGWYFSATQANRLFFDRGDQLLRLNVGTGQTGPALDIEDKVHRLESVLQDAVDQLNAGLGGILDPLTGLLGLGDLSDSDILDLGINLGGNLNVDRVLNLISTLDNSGLRLVQTHSSYDEQVHSATLQNASTDAVIGCIAYGGETDDVWLFPRRGDYDECQLDKSGRWLVIKEDLNNRIIDLKNGTERTLFDADGAGGHSDMGFGYMIAQDNQALDANTWKLWNLGDNPLSSIVTYYNRDFNVAAPNHISFTNASSSIPISEQHVCGSSANRNNAPHANEIVCFRLNDSKETLVVAPVMTDLNAPGGQNDYAKAPKGNLDPTGEYFIWSSNMGGSRLDAFMVQVPTQRFGTGDPDGGGGAPAPADPPSDTVAPVITLTGNVIGTNEATINWVTDEPADSRLDFGLTSTYGNATETGPVGRNHSHTISNLEPATAYHFRAVSMDASGNAASTTDKVLTTASASEAPSASTPVNAASVTWTDIELAEVIGMTIRKSGGCDGCPDAHASSTRQISGGDGYLQFDVGQPEPLLFVGLTSTPAVDSPDAMDFALRFQGGRAEIREAGTYIGDISFAAGDQFRIEIYGDTLRYRKNGAIFHERPAIVHYPLTAAVFLNSFSGTITDAIIDDVERAVHLTGVANTSGCDEPVHW